MSNGQWNAQCTVGQKKQKTINSNKKYRREMKLIPFNIDYCVLHFDVLIFFLRISGQGGECLLNFNF